MSAERRTHKLLFELRKHPYLYDKTHPKFNQKEDRDKVWDTIAANIFQDQWDSLTYAEKAKRAKCLQTKITPEEYEYLVKHRIPVDLPGSDTQSSEHILGNRRNNLTAEDVQQQGAKSPVNPSTAKNEVRVDADQELLLLYLLPTYKLLTPSDKRDVLHECYNIMKSGQKDTEKVPSE
ncbi:Alcohol dehydrogenase transcription factor Myb/SANT-like [Popillia japonica]|uniref:Alcohol dehydrogenase transcription factor Myb/SANT-like n=1 Tax=Popillia japonica TaxID=7064 RepID=A0AAW1J016_POPJA